MNNWYEVKAKFVKQMDDGRLKRVTEPYLIDAVSHMEAEERAWKEVLEHVAGEVIVTGITPKNYSDIYASDESCDLWWACVVGYRSIDGDNGNEKYIKSNILVEAVNIDTALESLKTFIVSFTVDTFIHSIKETSIVEVLPYKPSND
ncbi:DUF4494 domain-containing protein [Brumimicrobium mesophilum]|uniref:DUF4494 domain-containing protein n=1 Tax=Brumimicrobium mesophilum TaxID=392717 RepID=UPI000D143DA3|nr:DUF4494 domain-containing protein [Brumimicrobium mesophilum]